jgi:acetyl esterase/lipase
MIDPIRGFWSAYLPARKFLHALLRKELSTNPATLYFTGHSLGGALTTLAAYDISIHTIPRINHYLKAKKRYLSPPSLPSSALIGCCEQDADRNSPAAWTSSPKESSP